MNKQIKLEIKSMHSHPTETKIDWKLNLVFFISDLNPEILAKLFNLIYDLNLTPTLTVNLTQSAIFFQ